MISVNNLAKWVYIGILISSSPIWSQKLLKSFDEMRFQWGLTLVKLPVVTYHRLATFRLVLAVLRSRVFNLPQFAPVLSGKHKHRCGLAWWVGLSLGCVGHPQIEPHKLYGTDWVHDGWQKATKWLLASELDELNIKCNFSHFLSFALTSSLPALISFWLRTGAWSNSKFVEFPTSNWF